MTTAPEEPPKLRLPMRAVRRDGRSLDRLIEHYLVEKRLAATLKAAAKAERAHLYTALYDEYSRLCPDRKILSIAADNDVSTAAIRTEFNALKRFLGPEMTFLEIGPGSGHLTRMVAGSVERCLAVDVSHEVAKQTAFPGNVAYLVSDGSSIPANPDSVDFAYSNQLMEHLHPDDAADQLTNIWRALKPGAAYLCITPNRLTGPHDISKFFDETATGFHLKEYTLNELATLLRSIGFRRVRRALLARGLNFGAAPIAPFILYERFVEWLSRGAPPPLRRMILRNWLTRGVLQVAVIADK